MFKVISAYRNVFDEKGELVTRGYEEYTNVLYQNDMPQHGLSTYSFNGTNKLYNKTKEDLRASVDIVGDFGGIFEINNKVDFYVGAFCSYGFLDILPKSEFHHTYVDVAATEQKLIIEDYLDQTILKIIILLMVRILKRHSIFSK